MRKLVLLTVVSAIYVISAAQQNVGVGTTSPSSKLDINGSLALREGAALTLGNGGAHGGTNDNIALPHITGTTDIASFYRITGPSAVFSIYGIAPASGADGQVVTLVNTTGYVMTVINNNSSTAANSIITQTGANLIDNAGSTANSSITLQYNKTAGRWYVTGTQNFTVSSGSIATNSSSVAGIVTAGGGNNNKVWGTDGSGNPGWNSVSNTQLANSSLTVTPGTGIGVAGSPVSLGGAVTLTNTGVTSITGTTNQVNASAATGAVTLSLPQNINTTATPTFSTLTVNGANTNDIIATSSIQVGSTTAAASGNAGAIQYTGGALEYSNGSTWLPVTTGGGSNYWTLSGSFLYNNSGTNVGIGTTTPGSPLTVVGTTTHSTPMVDVQGNGDIRMAAQGVMFFDNNYSYASGSYIGPYSSTSGTYDVNTQKFSTAGAERVRITSTGNVGIGSVSPLVKLKVAGDVEANNQIRATGWLTGTGAGQGAEIGVSGGFSYLMGYDRTASAYSPFRIVGSAIDLRHSDASSDLYINSSGNVGISNSSPVAKLDVGGETKLLTVNQGSSTTERFYPNVISQAQDGSVTGAWIIHTPIARASNVMFTIRVHGYGYGAADVVDFTMSGYAYSGVNGNIDGVAGAVINDKLSDIGTDGWNKYIGVDASGNVAIAFGDIGNSAYFYRLSVDAWITRFTTDFSTGWSIDQNTTANFNWKDKTHLSPSNVLSAGSGNYIQNTTSAQASSNFNISGTGTTPTLYLTNSNTALTQGSGYALHVATPYGYTEYGAQNVSYSHFITDRPLYYFNKAIQVDGAISSYGADDLNLQTGGTSRIYAVNSTGNVGIGTTAPTSLLHLYNGTFDLEGPSTGSATINSSVYGMIIGPTHTRITTANTYYSGIAFNHLLNYSGVTTYNGAPGAWIGLRLYDTPGSERDYLTFATKSGTGTSGTGTDIPTEKMCIDPLGNVGIGTTAPGYPLDVNVAAGGWKAIFRGSDGYIQMGPANSSWAHIYTDRPNFIFNVPVYTVGNAFSSYSSGDLSLQTGGTTRIYAVNATGNVGIGNTSPGYTLDVTGQEHEISGVVVAGYTTTNHLIEQSNSGYNAGIVLRNSYYGNGVALFGRSGATEGLNVGSISSWGGYVPVYASAFTVTSDITMKKDVEYLENKDYINCLDQIRNVQSIRYRYKNESATEHQNMIYRPNLHIGVVAQSLPVEVSATIDENPTAANGQKKLGVSLSDLSGLMLAGIKAVDNHQQETDALIKAQQQRIDQLEKEIEELKIRK